LCKSRKKNREEAAPFPADQGEGTNVLLGGKAGFPPAGAAQGRRKEKKFDARHATTTSLGKKKEGKEREALPSTATNKSLSTKTKGRIYDFFSWKRERGKKRTISSKNEDGEKGGGGRRGDLG